MQRGAPFAPWVHAGLVGLVAIGTYWLTQNEVVTAGVLVAATRILGEALARVRPRPRYPMTPREHLHELDASVNGDIHQLVDLLAILKAELGLSIDTARRRLEAHYRQEERRGRAPDARK